VILALLYAEKKRSKRCSSIGMMAPSALEGDNVSNCCFAVEGQHAQAESLCCSNSHLSAPPALGWQSPAERLLSLWIEDRMKRMGSAKEARISIHSIKKQPTLMASGLCHVGLLML